jgi:hypothetical protein
MTFRQLPPVKVDGLGEYCGGLASSSAKNCLFVSDCDQHLVYKLELSARSKVSQWKVGRGPTGLSMNSANNLLVICGPIGIHEYTTSGSLVRKIVLNESDVSRPWHVMELTNQGQLVVSHGGPVHDVSVLNSRGQVVARSRHNLQSANKPFKYPLQLTACGNGRILVVDSGNNRIVELNDSLTWSRDLPLPVIGGLQEPCCLYLDESRDRLYVGEYDGKRVLVFDNFDNNYI